jgi:hypothetical protein
MKKVYLIRTFTSDQGTEGFLFTEDFRFNCKTLECPWRDNQKNISCIPSGIYTTTIKYSPKFGSVYWITNVPNRSGILIHSGNLAGDVSKGYKTHVNGCILLGREHGYLGDQRAILNSRVTVSSFKSIMANQTFQLQILGGV